MSRTKLPRRMVVAPVTTRRRNIDTMLYIPFDMRVTVITFDSHVPTDQELQDCRHVTMTSDEQWNPATVSLAAIR